MKGTTNSLHLWGLRLGRLAFFALAFFALLVSFGCGAQPSATPVVTDPSQMGGYGTPGGYYTGAGTPIPMSGYPGAGGAYPSNNLYANGIPTNSTSTGQLPFGSNQNYNYGGTAGITYANGIEAIFQQSCAQCHAISPNPQVLQQEGLVIPGNPNGSPLYQVLASGQMPQNGSPLPANEIQAIGQWIASGAQ